MINRIAGRSFKNLLDVSSCLGKNLLCANLLEIRFPFPVTHQCISCYRTSLSCNQTETAKIGQKRKFLPNRKEGNRIDDPDVFGTLSDNLESSVSLGDTEVETGDYFDSFQIVRRRGSQKKYAEMIRKCISEKRLRDAIDVLETKMLKEDGVKPEYYIYSILIGACANVGYTKKAFQLYNQMKKRGLRVTASTYTSLFNACANGPFPNDSLNRARHLRQLMIEKGVQPNAMNFNAMIKAFGRCGDIVTAFNLVDEMVDKKYQLTLDTFNNLLQACISDKEAGFRHSLLVWRKMIQKKVVPNVQTYNLMLRSVRECGIGNLEVAQELLEEIVREVNKNSAIKGIYAEAYTVKRLNEGEYCGRSSMIEPTMLKLQSGEISNDGMNYNPEKQNNNNTVACKEIVSNTEMSFSQYCPNLLDSTPNMRNLISLNETAKPEDRLLMIGGIDGVLAHMNSMGIQPDIKTFSILLDCIPQTMAAENELISAIEKHKIVPDIDFFNLLIKKRSMRKDYKSAKDVLTFIKHFKVLPDVVTFGVLALGCEAEEQANNLLSDMHNLGYRPNIEILGALLQNGCMHLNFHYVQKVMEVAKDEEIRPTARFLEKLDKFRNRCNKLLGSKEIQLKNEEFTKKVQDFNNYYKLWLRRVKPEEVVHPWKQYEQSDMSA